MEGGWDLQAVVRGCRGEAEDPSAGRDPLSSPSAPSPRDGDEELLLYFPELSSTKTVIQELLELCEPFLRGRRTALLPPPPPPPPQQLRVHMQLPRSKRRKNQLKKVVRQVPADGLSADMWAWRKYGQKPIKGSPFPRGYYRCSSSKGCPARKQVERCRTDPGMFLITYSAEHNHPVPTSRNTLAGSTRNKIPPLAAKIEAELPPDAREVEEDQELEEDQEEGLLMVSDMEVLGEDDMMFLDLDGADGQSPDRFSAVLSTTSWVESSATTAAGGS